MAQNSRLVFCPVLLQEFDDTVSSISELGSTDSVEIELAITEQY